MAFRKSILFIVLLLICYGLGLFLVYKRQHNELWIPKVSFNLPAFMYTDHMNPTSKGQNADSKNTLPPPSLSQNNSDIHVLFSKTPLERLTLTQPWEHETQAAVSYRKPFDVHSNQNKITLIISNLGIDEEIYNEALATLPDNVTLSFSSYTPHLAEKMTGARQEGFETMLNIPIETKDFPKHDPGNNAFYAFASDEENARVLNQLYEQKIPFIGFLSPRLSHFETTPFFQNLVQDKILSKGLIYVGTTTFNFPSRQVFTIDLSVVNNLYPEALRVFFNEAKAIAKDQGQAVLVLAPLPVVFHEIADWVAQEQDPSIQFVPMGSLLTEEENDA